MKKRKLELLAPAQNIEIAKTAVNYGADAVYIGASAFGARKMASNSIEDIEKLISYAHLFNVKIYITLNTILDDRELLEAEKLIKKLYEIGADALIIQDMGILELDIPPIELHMSTQCNIRTKEKVQFFEKIGMKRVVLARELSVEQIKEIHQNSNIELECFVHGALCTSYSGQCYMSDYIGSRSANRGVCAQACRRCYSLLDEKNKYIIKNKHLLSLKDFCAEKYLDDMIKAGVTSFKIEGRLKDENYVKNVVLYYRKLLDKYEKTSDGVILSDFEPDINKTFNRGYTTYFLGEENEIFNFETPKSTGEFLGLVSKVGKNYFEIDKNIKLTNQDGLFSVTKQDSFGFLVNKTEGKKIFPNKKIELNIKDKIYRNKSVEFENILKNSKTKRIIKGKLTVFKDKIELSDNKNTACVSFDEKEIAQNQEKMRENFKTSFKKSGNSIFKVYEIEFKTDNLPFLTVSKINLLRREVFEKLEKIRLQNYKREEFKRTTYAKYPKENNDYRLNIHNKKAEEFYKKCGIVPYEKSVECTKNYSNKELMRTKHCIRRALNICLKQNPKHKQLFLIGEDNKKYILNFDCKNCEMVIKPYQ